MTDQDDFNKLDELPEDQPVRMTLCEICGINYVNADDHIGVCSQCLNTCSICED